MITWTTPTQPVILNTGQLEACQCEVYGSFAQGNNVVTLIPSAIECDVSADESYMLFDLTQLQSGGFNPGQVEVQINIIDWMGYRAATPKESVYIGSNVLRKELVHA